VTTSATLPRTRLVEVERHAVNRDIAFSNLERKDALQPLDGGAVDDERAADVRQAHLLKLVDGRLRHGTWDHPTSDGVFAAADLALVAARTPS
jgi:hypothetical protein